LSGLWDRVAINNRFDGTVSLISPSSIVARTEMQFDEMKWVFLSFFLFFFFIFYFYRLSEILGMRISLVQREFRGSRFLRGKMEERETKVTETTFILEILPLSKFRIALPSARCVH